MNYLISFFRSKLDLSNIGLQRGEKESGYFCTPVGSKVIGWAGVDGIHFCTVKGFGELIFAVNPTYDPGHYVHPVARNFEDFLRLILACHDTAAIEQCWFMDREVFEEFLETNPLTEEMQACLNAIEKKYKLTPMEDPFAYMHQLQEEFDYDALVYPPEYYEIVDVPSERQPPEWKVTWDGDFFDDNPEAIGGEPVCVDTWFHWAGIDWYVPEVYPFDQGLVMCILGKVDPAQVPMEDYSEFLSNEAWEKMQAENPLNLHARHEMTINDIAMRPAGSTGSTWVSYLTELPYHLRARHCKEEGCRCTGTAHRHLVRVLSDPALDLRFLRSLAGIHEPYCLDSRAEIDVICSCSRYIHILRAASVGHHITLADSKLVVF